jgi:CBS domain containing-hemolysin-like protein
MTVVETVLLIAWFGCFAGVASLSVAEVAVIRVRRSGVLVQAEAGHPRSRALLVLIDDLPHVLNTVYLVVLLLQVFVATAGGFLAERWFGNVGITVTTVATTALLFLYAEAIPKTMAVRSPERMSLLVTPALTVLVRALRPIVTALVWLADKQTPGTTTVLSAFSEEELRALTHEAANAGVIATDDAALVDRSFDFGDRSVAEVMVGRESIAAIRSDRSVADALSIAVAFGHRRLPVYEGTLDEITGIVRLRDVADVARRSPQATVASFVAPVLRCGPHHPISQLLREMQANGPRLAIVTDADGRTLGLATIEDVVAELVGEIADDGPPPSSPDQG